MVFISARVFAYISLTMIVSQVHLSHYEYCRKHDSLPRVAQVICNDLGQDITHLFFPPFHNLKKKKKEKKEKRRKEKRREEEGCLVVFK